MPIPEYVLTLSCPDRRGIVAAVSAYLAGAGGNIADAAQFGDADTGRFFMRVHVVAEEPGVTADSLRAGFAPVAERFAMDWQLHDLAIRPRVLVLVSRFGHCLNDLLYRHRSGLLDVDLPLVVSNHPDFAALTASYRIPFRHLPVTPDTRDAQEQALRDIIATERIDLVVLARYMQILSPSLCELLTGRAINIHHSFLPSFSGARPYHQAHTRGVKLIGATAHYVTATLDDGPIIEQDVVRVSHADGPDRLAALGRDVECRALARAVTWHVEHRILINGHRTVVFA
ncbi:Formyltetrahydrofolate deformylase [Frankia canadensis]|uniref:Formyltetrahydrofolate deformylase n=1 Tax=Frankia canadensis TaxID=1836972 RepID=A0A2I2L069_9ACTN|nr:formyltetrahydrofolate deformylase [Frankia canadensis]SNQ51314.1 Formyltetrahydrofolate deformylase [Frankia canadensis]SOU58604.1 Formyltetrahydrofolate deformylase [Frankia canadensis]